MTDTQAPAEIGHNNPPEPTHAEALATCLTEGKDPDAYLKAMEKKFAAMTFDMADRKSREELRSTAAGISKVKASVERTAKDLTEEWRAKTAKVNGSKNTIIERLDEIKAKTRKPLTDFEEHEADIKKRGGELLEMIDGQAEMPFDADSSAIEARIDLVKKISFPDDLADYLDTARAKALVVLDTLAERLKHVKVQEQQAAQIKAMQEADAARQAEADRQAAQLAELQARAEKAEAEAKDAQDAAEAAERQLEADRQAAADREAAAAEKAAQEAAQRAEDEARAEAEARAAAERAEQDRIKAEAEAAERAARRAERTTEVKVAIMEYLFDLGGDEDIADALIAGKVPHTTVTIE